MSSTSTLRFRTGISGAFIAPLIFLVGATVHFVFLGAFDMNALTMSALVGLMLAALVAKDYARFWESVIAGIATPIAMTVTLILFIVGPLAALVEETGVSEGFVWLATEIGVGGGAFPAVVFVAACAMSMSTGTSLGTLFTAFPIFYPAGAALGAEPALLAGAILSGALFGDNLAPISDTTIVSATTQRFRTRPGVADVAGVVATRAKYALTAAGASLVLYLLIGTVFLADGPGAAPAAADASPRGLVMLIPIVALFVVAFVMRDLYLAITVGLVGGTVTALLAGLMTPAGIVSAKDGTAEGFLIAGVEDMLPLIGLSLMVFGMLGVLQAAGVLELVVTRISESRLAGTPAGAEVAIGGGQSIVTALFAGVVGPSIVTFGPVVDRIGASVGLHPYRRANVMDCFAMGAACVLPALSAFLFISSDLTGGVDGMPGLSPASIFLACLYPLVLTVIMVFSVVTGWGRTFEGPDGAQVKEPPSTSRSADRPA
ncbi:Na+/H+ antiporter NhaC family protein [Pseudonocardia sp. C8]|uniref:Na+/H+ antiporter NhaC family protein n=1 Tax=Pseudonocardia sp. C8 TaxID=2762759 RepID=UPI00164273D6|nr:Na+/H+ antiporter NhaC family protein [Pseudonocardia sp. C8]MBC3189597.1 Na+/H+ antiporter NhaC family protein [Pseudonocardia sp. C8]